MNIPEAAIQATADAIEERAFQLLGRDLGTIYRNEIVAAGLAAALPLLGDTTIEWASGMSGYQVPSVSEAGAKAAANLHGTQLWQRTVITGEWTRVQRTETAGE